MLVLAASLFFTSPEPLDMPKADAFLVQEDGRNRLEDRYDRLDLWTSRAVLGCWSDDDGRVFTLAKLDVAPPSIGVHESETRVDYTASCVPLTSCSFIVYSIIILCPRSLPDLRVHGKPRSRLLSLAYTCSHIQASSGTVSASESVNQRTAVFSSSRACTCSSRETSSR